MKATIEHSFCPYCDEVQNSTSVSSTRFFSQPMKRNCVPAWNAYKKKHALMIISSSAMASITYGFAKDVPVIKKRFSSIG